MSERVWRTASTKYVRLLCERASIKPRGRSRRLQRVLTDFGCEHSFAHAAGRVLEQYGFEISVSAVRETTLVLSLLPAPAGHEVGASPRASGHEGQRGGELVAVEDRDDDDGNHGDDRDDPTGAQP